MTENNHKSRLLTAFHGFEPLKKGAILAGYAALLQQYSLAVPFPDQLCAIGPTHKIEETGRWRLFTPRHKPDDSLKGHLTFALKYEGIDLGLLKTLFRSVEDEQIAEIVRSEPTGAYSRRIWFLYEWLCDTKLDVEDVKQGNYVELINEAFQYPGPSRDSKRHRIRNNLPGTQNFCPLIRRTEKLDRFIEMNLSKVALDNVGRVHADLLSRAAAFLLLEDSKASYTIEGEKPPHNRIERWGRIIGEAGRRPLSIEELEHLQSIVIADSRFVMPGCRVEGGFVGEHDRTTRIPIPVHISANHKDLELLLSGLIETSQLLTNSEYDAVLSAAMIAFGFVFIHPFEDGNGRIHRYLFHHMLAEKAFVSKGLVFPISAVILKRIDTYRETLEHFSKPRLNLIEWRPTADGNVDILNETADLYRYFDATKQAEFLFECVEETVNKTLLDEVRYLDQYDRLNDFIKNYIDMPDKMVDLMISFLNQHQGMFSKRALEKEFSELTEVEVNAIEAKYAEVFSTR